jgi:hypothetical protein
MAALAEYCHTSGGEEKVRGPDNGAPFMLPLDVLLLQTFAKPASPSVQYPTLALRRCRTSSREIASTVNHGDYGRIVSSEPLSAQNPHFVVVQ